jgi:RNA polymerase sigma factor (sigma-70 family)
MILGPKTTSRFADGQLLGRYVDGHDEAAFADLVLRHGPMVLGLCERMLPQAHDAEDAFQATFLVLVKKAAILDRKGSLANWLHKVAYRIAVKARIGHARRVGRERERSAMLASPHVDADWNCIRPILDEELNGLPEKQRALLVLYYLEGKSQQQVARELRIPAGSIGRHLSRARNLLRSRLARRGIFASGALFSLFLPFRARAGNLPVQLVVKTIQSARKFRIGSAAGSLRGRAERLAEAILRSPILSNTKLIVPVIFVLGALGLLWTVASQRTRPQNLAGASSVAFGGAKPFTSCRATRWRLRAEFQGEDVISAALSRDGNLVALGGRFPQVDIRLWEISSRAWRGRLAGHSGSVHAVAFSRDGTLLASGSQDRTVKVWDVATGQMLQTFRGHELGVMAISFDANGRELVSGSIDRSVKIWDLATGQERATLLGHRRSVVAVRYAANGRLVASASQDGTVKIWDADSMREMSTLQNSGVTSLCFSPDSRKLAAGNDDGTVKVWDVQSGGLQATYHAGGPVRQVIFDRDGGLLSAQTPDLEMPIWLLPQELKSKPNDFPGATVGCQWLTIEPGGLIRAWDLKSHLAREPASEATK